uniref:Ethylene-responsive transcription factor 4-like n=1 Tax=Rhizophora mucronata TaxID=61149 RepID=A0A2P2LY36_RHIMU
MDYSNHHLLSFSVFFLLTDDLHVWLFWAACIVVYLSKRLVGGVGGSFSNLPLLSPLPPSLFPGRAIRFHCL